MIVNKLEKQGLIHPPKWLPDNILFLGYGGSVSYGASADTSDMDCFGFCMPPKHLLFPYSIGGEILGFGKQHQRFNVWSEHHIKTPDNKKEYDFSVYNIVDFFQLALENNPNILDILFLPRRCILHTTQIGELVRENRKLFLHKGAMHKLRGYMFSQMSKIKNKTNSNNLKRAALIERFGFDTKFAMNVVRLALEAEQILVEHDLDIERNSEILKSIRRGEWTLEQIDSWATEKEKSLETLYANSTLRNVPDEPAIKELLLRCLEQHYGNLSDAIAKNPSMDKLLEDLRNIVDRYTTNIPVDTSENL
jgi:predicted nucleotidyltransferase